MNRLHTRTACVIGVVIALALVLCIQWFLGGEAHFKIVGVFALGFLAGMLSMYIRLAVIESLKDPYR